MLESTVGQILVNDSLPEDLRDYSRVLDKSALSSLLKDVARKYPERYREISFELSQVGRRSAQEQGGFSFGARHLRKSKAAQAIQQKIKSELMGILSDESLTDQQRTDKIVRVVGRESSAQQKAVLEEAVKENNPLGLQVLSGSRGKPMNLASLLAADMLYSDHRDEVIPIPVLRSYSQGLTPAEYWAGTYGARRGIIATKFATQEAGFLCLAGDTMVRMADWSVKAIRDIKPGDMVIGSDKSGNTFPVKVSAKFENGKKELWRFRFRFGKSRKKFVEIVATKEHKALIEHLRRLRRRPATKLVIQTKTDVKPLGECERRSVSWHALLPVQSYTGGGKKEPLAWLIGWLIGEGGLTGHNTNVSGGDVVLIEEAKRRCKESGFSLNKRKNKDYEYTIHDDNPLPYEGNPGGGIAPNSFRCRLRKRLSELGLLQLKAHQKFIPDEVFSWDNESIAELIAWLIAGDGCVASIKNSTIPAIQLGLTADKVVRQVAELLMCRFGIYSQITVTPPQEKGNFPVSHLAINDRESVCRFLQYIGCATGAKQSLLLKLSEAIKPAFRRDKFLFHYFDKEYVGIEDTFDIEVDHPDHLFVLENGAIVSNSKQLNQAGHRLVVVDEDTDEVSPVTRGLIVDTDDMDNEGSLLAQDTGPFKRNTPLTPKILKQLKRLGKDRILVRSPLVGGSPEGGVYARDVGVREKGLLPGRGEQVGLQAAQALSEPISQGQLCLAAGTLVRMADWTVKPIEQICVDDQVLGSDKNGKLFPVKVIRFYDNGERDCVRTIFREAKTKQHVDLISTLDHKLLAKARYWALPSERIEYGILPVGLKCVGYSVKLASLVVNERGKYEPFAALCGLLLGDGCYTLSVHGVHWSCFEPDLVAEMQPYFNSLGLKATKLKDHEGYYRISQLHDSVNQDPVTGRLLAGDRNPALIWLKKHSMHGKYAHEKTIPTEVWDWNQQSVSQLLSCLFATDGSVYVPTDRPDELYINFCSTSLELAQQVKELLRIRFAVHSSSIGNHKGKRKRKLYSFTITRKEQVRRFANSILIPGRKGRMLLDYLPKLNSDDSTEYFHRQSQEFVGKVDTYDIEVDHPDHLFVLANGLIVSNSAKHSGGVAGQEKAVGGFQYINQLIQTPKKMQGGAAHSTVDGMVQHVEPAPAGGSYVIINGEKHYVNAGYELKVKKGDEVEAGDLISDGIPNPAIITKYKGVGEGRRYFVREFKKAMASSGMFGHRRNIELLARGLINHVRLTEEVGEHVQDDIIPYSTLEHTYTPREGFQALAPKKAVGKYLERPVLHYTIGTKVRPSMLKDFDEFGVTAVDVHDNPPPFESHMVRGMYQLQHDPDWLTQMYGSGLKESLLESVARGGKSEQRGSSFVPSLATGTDFGDVPDRVVIKPQAPYALPNVKIPDLPDSLLSSPTPKMPEKLSASIMPPNV